jgi:hypothetical protein
MIHIWLWDAPILKSFPFNEGVQNAYQMLIKKYKPSLKGKLLKIGAFLSQIKNIGLL